MRSLVIEASAAIRDIFEGIRRRSLAHSYPTRANNVDGAPSFTLSPHLICRFTQLVLEQLDLDSYYNTSTSFTLDK